MLRRRTFDHASPRPRTNVYHGSHVGPGSIKLEYLMLSSKEGQRIALLIVNEWIVL